MYDIGTIIYWDKSDCPFCGQDGKTWQWKPSGGQAYLKCNHQYQKVILTREMTILVKEIEEKQNRYQELSEMIKSSKEMK